MKKFLVLAALALCTVGFVTQAFAGSAVGVHKGEQQLVFRNHLVQVGQADCDGGYTDSLVASGIAKFDTTAAIPTSGWTYPPSGAALTDSMQVLVLHVYESQLYSTVTLGKTSATAESIYVKTQISPDGCSWSDLPILASHAPVLNAWTAQVTVNAAVTTFVSSTNTGISNKSWRIPFGTATYRPAYPILMAPYVRWIISGTRATTNHSLKAKVLYWSSNDELNR